MTQPDPVQKVNEHIDWIKSRYPNDPHVSVLLKMIDLLREENKYLYSNFLKPYKL